MDLLDMMWRGVAVPTLASATLVAVMLRPWNRAEAPSKRLAAAAPVGLSLGYALAHLALLNWNWPGFPPGDALHWPLYLAGAALVFALLERGLSPSGWPKWLLRFSLVTLTVTMVALPQLRSLESAARNAPVVIALIGGFVVWWGLMEALAKRLPRGGSMAALLLAITGASLTLVLSGTGLVAQLVGAVAAAAGPLLVVGVWRPDLSIERLALPLATLLLAALWANGLLYTYAELGRASLLHLLGPIAAVGLARQARVARALSASSRSQRWTAVAGLALAGLLPVAGAVLLAFRASAEMVYY